MVEMRLWVSCAFSAFLSVSSSFAFAAAAACMGKKAHTLSLAFACLMGLSRMYLYVHYPTDVLVSVVLGSLFAVIGHILAQKINLPEFQIGKRGKYQA